MPIPASVRSASRAVSTRSAGHSGHLVGQPGSRHSRRGACSTGAARGGESAFVADGGGNLTLSQFGVSRAPSNGITVKVPDAATGTFHVRLEEVVIRDNGLHGILVNDQAEYFDDPASTSEDGSDAGLWWRWSTAASSGTASR